MEFDGIKIYKAEDEKQLLDFIYNSFNKHHDILDYFEGEEDENI